MRKTIDLQTHFSQTFGEAVEYATNRIGIEEGNWLLQDTAEQVTVHGKRATGRQPNENTIPNVCDKWESKSQAKNQAIVCGTALVLVTVELDPLGHDPLRNNLQWKIEMLKFKASINSHMYLNRNKCCQREVKQSPQRHLLAGTHVSAQTVQLECSS
jgi:hypothetical protein